MRPIDADGNWIRSPVCQSCYGVGFVVRDSIDLIRILTEPGVHIRLICNCCMRDMFGAPLYSVEYIAQDIVRRKIVARGRYNPRNVV